MNKGAVALAAISGILVILKLVFQARSARQAAEDKIKAETELGKMRREAEERAARHARESEERSREAEERRDDRAQKEKLISQLQASTSETLAVLKNELAVRDASSARSFEYLDRNTRATEKLAETALAQAAEMRELRNHVAELRGGAGCRAAGRLT